MILFLHPVMFAIGDKSFSPWKGSVVDSVVGAFLTQNFYDHFSSSAFMYLAARYSNHILNGMSKNLWPERNDLWPSTGKTDFSDGAAYAHLLNALAPELVSTTTLKKWRRRLNY